MFEREAEIARHRAVYYWIQGRVEMTQDEHVRKDVRRQCDSRVHQKNDRVVGQPADEKDKRQQQQYGRRSPPLPHQPSALLAARDALVDVERRCHRAQFFAHHRVRRQDQHTWKMDKSLFVFFFKNQKQKRKTTRKSEHRHEADDAEDVARNDSVIPLLPAKLYGDADGQVPVSSRQRDHLRVQFDNGEDRHEEEKSEGPHCCDYKQCSFPVETPGEQSERPRYRQVPVERHRCYGEDARRHADA